MGLIRLKQEAEIYAENATPIEGNCTRGWTVEALELAYLEGVRRGLKIAKAEIMNDQLWIDSYLNEAEGVINARIKPLKKT